MVNALKHTAVNDEICKETAECGGMRRVVELMQGPATGHAGLAKAGCSKSNRVRKTCASCASDFHVVLSM